MNERQEYALLHPLSSAELRGVPEAVARYRDTRKDKRAGLLLMSMLAVDR